MDAGRVTIFKKNLPSAGFPVQNSYKGGGGGGGGDIHFLRTYKMVDPNSYSNLVRIISFLI